MTTGSGRRVHITIAIAVLALTAAGLTATQQSVQGPPPTGIPSGNTTDKPQPPANAAISGVVIDGNSGEGVPGAIVYITSQPVRVLGAQTRQMTDDRGRFVFVNLPGDTNYSLSASKFGYLDGGYGRDVMPTDPLRAIPLKNDEWASNLKVAIWKPASISGVIRDEGGDPLVGIFVRVFLRHRIQGREDLIAGPLTTTNDRGEYRISGLAPGKYLVQVPSVQASIPSATKLTTPPGSSAPDGVMDIDDTNRLVINRYPLPPPPSAGRAMTYPAMFHPSTAVVADAGVIDLKYGDDRTSVDLTLRPVPCVRVSGTVDGPPDAIAGLTLRLLPAGLENQGIGAEAATALVGADGRFTFLNVAAGSYTIDAPTKIGELSTIPFTATNRSQNFPVPPPTQGRSSSLDTIELIPGMTYSTSTYRSNAGEWSGRATVTVGGGDVNGLVVRMRPHATMSGRVITEADPSQPDVKPPARFFISLDPAGSEAYLGRPQQAFQNASPDSFSIPGIIPASYWLRVQGAPGWLIKSIQWKGRDYSTAPFDAASSEDLSGVIVTVTNAVPELAGSVRGTDALKADASMVIAFPTDPASWRNVGFWPARIKSAPVSSTGTYRITTLPAGEYFVAAISRSLAQTWRDPAILAQVARSAARVTLTWAGKSSQEINVVVVR